MSLYINALLQIMIWFLPLYCLARVIWLWRRGDRPRPARELVMAVFVLFMAGLLTLTFENHDLEWLRTMSFARVKARIEQGLGVNFVPFRTIRSYLRHASGSNIMVNIVGNIVMFIPWGMGLPLLWKKYRSFWKMIFMSLILPILIEFCQLFIGRSVDVDDVILNFIGGMLGALCYLILRRVCPVTDRLAE